MWRKLATIMLLFILVQSASASLSLNVNVEFKHNTSSVTDTSIAAQTVQQATQQEKLKTLKFSLTTDSALDNEQSDEPLTLPRIIRASASLFTSEIQASPDYALVIEFFAVKLCAALFKNLSNPPLLVDWFEQVGANNSSSRLSGWKDSNSLYKSTITYHS